MREFAIPITQLFVAGLRRHSRSGKPTGLVGGRGVRVVDGGLEGMEIPYYPGATLTSAFPQEQLLMLRNGFVLAGESLSNMEIDGAFWVRRPIVPIHYQQGYDMPLLGKGEWHVADAGETVLMTNGTSMLFSKASPNGWKQQKDVVLNSVCFTYGGRFVLGGFDINTVFSKGAIEVMMSAFRQVAVVDGISVPTPFADRNWVMWSSIGGGDFPFWLFASDTTFDSDLFFDKLKRNEFGWMPMPKGGEVLGVVPLGKNVIVYMDTGVFRLTPFPGSEHAPPTFGIEKISDIGVSSRSSFGASNQQHVFISKKGSLWLVGADGTASKLGFEEYLYPIIRYPHRIVYDEDEAVFYISSSATNYVLSTGGLFESNYAVSSGIFHEGAFIGTAEQKFSGVFLLTEEMDMSTRTIKMLRTVVCDVEAEADVYASIHYRYNSNDPWRKTKNVILNKEGAAAFAIAGLEFRIEITCGSSNNFRLNDAVVKWQRSDRRTVRGPDADPSTTGASEQ